MNIRKLASLAFMWACGLASPAAATVIGAPGDANTGNCYPFGCLGWGAEYQQVYASSDFSGPLTINQLTFYHQNYQDSGQLDGGLFSISLSTTQKLVNGLDTVNLTNNIGANSTLVFSGALPAILPFGSRLDLAITPFTYDPTVGNLLLDVTAVGATESGFGTEFDAHIFQGVVVGPPIFIGSFGAESSRAYSNDPLGQYSKSWGLVTGFNDPSPVPEPATLFLFGAGLAGLSALRHRRKAKA